jgi:streptogramin lyase
MRRLFLVGAVSGLVLGLVGCSGGGRPAGAPGGSATPGSATPGVVTAAPSRPAASASGGPTRIDIGGGQTYGLVATADAVWATSFDASTAVRIDPATNAVTATVPVPGGATSIIDDHGALWVAGYGSPGQPGTLTRISAGAAATSFAPGEVCCDLSTGGGLLWVVDPSGAVLAVDGPRAKVVHRFPVTLDRNVHVNAVYGGDSVWVASDSGPLYRMDPDTGRVTTLDVGGGVPFLVDSGRLWGARPDALWAVDVATGRVARTVPLADSTEVMALAVGGDSIWVGLRHPGRVGAVVRLAAGTGKAVGETPVDVPARIVVAFGSAWVTDSGGRDVIRLPA